MFQNIAACRLYSTVYSNVKVKKGTSVRDLFHTPVFKSLFLTLVLGSAVVEATRNRKELDALRGAYEAKFGVLENATARIRRRERVDMAAELKLANALTRNKYNSVTDVQMDEQFEAFLKMAEDTGVAEPEEKATAEQNTQTELPILETDGGRPRVRKSADFL